MLNCYFLDVGHGNCTVLVDTDGVVVIDAGPKSKLLKFLRDRKNEGLDRTQI